MSSVKWVLLGIASVLLAASVAACVGGGFEIYHLDQRITKLEHPLRTAPTTTTSSTDYALVPYVNRQLAQINEQLQSIKGPDPNGASITHLNDDIGQIGTEFLNFLLCLENAGSPAICASTSGPGG
jgi:hypothetical protein